MLQYEIENLKHLIEVPKLYITEKLSQLKSDIDLDYISQIASLEKSDPNKLYIDQLKNEWLNQINFVDAFENDCFRKLNPLTEEDKKSALDLIRSIEDNKINKDKTNVFDLIQAEIFKIESKIFLNKSLLFIKKTNETGLSKLVITPNESISWRAIKQFKEK